MIHWDWERVPMERSLSLVLLVYSRCGCWKLQRIYSTTFMTDDLLYRYNCTLRCLSPVSTRSKYILKLCLVFFPFLPIVELVSS